MSLHSALLTLNFSSMVMHSAGSLIRLSTLYSYRIWMTAEATSGDEKVTREGSFVSGDV